MQKSKLSQVLRSCRKSFGYVGLFSCFVNLLMLTIPLYMLQIFDRVLSSQSYDTLIYLTILAMFALLIMSVLDGSRSRVLLKVSHWLDNSLSPFALANSAESSLRDPRYTRQSLKDITTIREFLCGMDILSLFDAPWTFIYLAVVYMLHPALGLVATIGVVVLVLISFISEYTTRGLVAEVNKENMASQIILETALSNAESIRAMGMLDNVVRKWFGQNEKMLKEQDTASARSTIYISLAKFFRMALQISILGVGAFYVVKGQITGGAMIAASILTSRAMAPVERVIVTWKHFLNVRQAYARVSDFLKVKTPFDTAPFMADPKGHLKMENVYYRPEGAEEPIIRGVSMQILPGDIVAVIGPSGAGKSTLARLMLGIWSASHGTISMDGCDIAFCDRSELGRHVGYCPQDVRLLVGSIKENIARMTEAENDDVAQAAKFAGAHEMILGLPSGYNTLVSQFGLSGGQQQRIAMSRAFFGDPCFVVLDEPNSNLDEDGTRALVQTLKQSKEKGITMVLVTHQPAFLQLVDKIAVMNNGALQAYGPRDQVLQHMKQAVAKQSAAMNSNA